jgi:hypothetical protein
MASLPSHPDAGGTNEGTGVPSGPGSSSGRSRLRAAALIVLVLAALAVIVILHLTGILGEGTHG